MMVLKRKEQFPLSNDVKNAVLDGLQACRFDKVMAVRKLAREALVLYGVSGVRPVIDPNPKRRKLERIAVFASSLVHDSTAMAVEKISGVPVRRPPARFLERAALERVRKTIEKGDETCEDETCVPPRYQAGGQKGIHTVRRMGHC